MIAINNLSYNYLPLVLWFQPEARVCLDVGADPSDLMSTHPYKPANHLPIYRDMGVTFLTIDSKFEMDKVLSAYPEAR